MHLLWCVLYNPQFIFVALYCSISNLPLCPLECGYQNGTQCSSTGLTNGTDGGKITPLSYLLPFWISRVHQFYLPHWHPGSSPSAVCLTWSLHLFQLLLFRIVSYSIGLACTACPKCTILHLDVLKHILFKRTRVILITLQGSPVLILFTMMKDQNCLLLHHNSNSWELSGM